MQLFVRRRDGIEGLSDLLKQLAKGDEDVNRASAVAGEIQAALVEIRAVKAELEKLGDPRGDRDLMRARAVLRKRLRTATRKLSGNSENPRS